MHVLVHFEVLYLVQKKLKKPVSCEFNRSVDTIMFHMHILAELQLKPRGPRNETHRMKSKLSKFILTMLNGEKRGEKK